MDVHPVIRSITIYPVKSLDGIRVQKAQIGNGGSLLHDRSYAIFNSNGKYVNGKSNAMVHLLRAKFDIDRDIISLKHNTASTWQSFHLKKDIADIDEFLSGFFKMQVTLKHDMAGNFLDVPVKSGITILSAASLEMVGSWFNEMPAAETAKRFRANIEISDVPAFWEDRLFFEKDTAVEFRVGDTVLYGLSPRARCVVPARHPQTGENMHAFQKSFADQRAASLPTGSTLHNFGHTYYLSVDCYIPHSEFGKWIAVGDELTISGKKKPLI